MTDSKKITSKMSNPMTTRYLIVAGIIIAAFFGSYSLAIARANRVSDVGTATSARAGTTVATANGGTAACACCGGSGSGAAAPIESAATVNGDVQTISVDLSSGSYNPNTLKLKAGIPAEITFGQSSGCTAQVQSQDLGFSEDLTGGPVTVKLGALKAGTYSFACGMQMVTGTIVVE